MTQTAFGEIRAAVLREPNGPFEIEKLTIDRPGPNEVLVRIVAVGMCHTDLAVRARHLPTPLPAVLGHEGAGIVEAVGAGVQKVVPGDHVVLTFPSCGLCDSCLTGHPSQCFAAFPLYFGGARLDGSHGLHCAHGPLHDRFFAQSSFATHSLATERNVVKVPKDAPLELLGPLACGIQTGAGAVLNSLRVRTGESFAVFGSGSVGLSAVMAARLCGARHVIAVDVLPSRLELARQLGATHAIDGREQDAFEEVRRITGAGVHHALDTTGRVEVIRGALNALRPGGVCGVLGASAPGSELPIDVNMFIGMSKTLRGIVEGDSVPDIFIPQLVALHLQGAFPFDRLVRFYALDEINQAVQDSEAGRTIKPIIRMPA
ncbi:MAG TPA: NAD(P)-dependent alcohol dehydrogenase [Steroidobacteraceae bacterium]|nr:NAD(P)-dependent alcohol dehydrogenase [Steroidobacteraceae bacterium]